MPAILSTRLLALTVFAGVLGVSAPAFAECQEEMGKIMTERQGMISQLNALTGGQKKQLDPAAACPKLRNLAAIEGKLVAYLEKNKDWCNVPDQFVENAKLGRGKSQAFAAKACQVAAQVAKMKQQQAQGGPAGNQQQAQKLPSGPL